VNSLTGTSAALVLGLAVSLWAVVNVFVAAESAARWIWYERDYANRRLSPTKVARALTTHDPRTALAWYPMVPQSVQCDGLRGEGRLGWRGRQQMRASLG
jgi:hypothetical protein